MAARHAARSRAEAGSPPGGGVRRRRWSPPALRDREQVFLGVFAYAAMAALVALDIRVRAALSHWFGWPPMVVSMAPFALLLLTLHVLIRWRWPWFLLGLALSLVFTCMLFPYLVKHY